MKKQLLLLILMMLPLLASAQDIEVKNADGVTIYYNYINNGTELEVVKGNNSYYYGDVNIPETVTYMNRTRKVTSIGDEAFYSSWMSSYYNFGTGLTSVIIPNSVTIIHNRAFLDCSKLTSIIVPSSVEYIGNEAFKNCSGLTSVTIPNSVISIGKWAFDGCTGLTSVTIGNCVTNIGDEAFRSCSGLKKVIINDIAAWCNIKFGTSDANPLHYAHHLYSDENTEIKDLIIPNNVTSIGSCAFPGCSSFTSATIGNGVRSIGGSAFAACSGLTSVTIPNSVTSIEDYAFRNCI